MKNKKITMQYPYDPSNPYYDGQIHEIKPLVLIPVFINGQIMFVLEYIDVTLGGGRFTTLLVRNGDRFYKVPLDKYGYVLLAEFVEQHPRLRRFSPNVIANNANWVSTIGVAASISIDPSQFSTVKKPGKPSYACNFYVPINVNGFSDIQNNSYRSNGVISTYGSENQEYRYAKTPVCDSIASGLREGLFHPQIGENSNPAVQYLIDDGVRYTNFEVELPEGEMSICNYMDSDGVEHSYSVLYPPGNYSVTGYYSDFIRLRDYNDSRECQGIRIYAPTNDYLDTHDYPRVFRDGGLMKLRMEFDSSRNQGFNPENLTRGR